MTEETKAKAKKKKIPANKLSLDKWRDRGYMVQTVEHWIQGGRIKKRRDLFGIIDIVAIGNGETIGIQSTSRSNMRARVKKIEDNPSTVANLRDAHWRLIVEGWDKPKFRYRCKEIEVS